MKLNAAMLETSRQTRWEKYSAKGLFQVTCRGSTTHLSQAGAHCILQRHAEPSGSLIRVEEDSFSRWILILNMHGSHCIPGLFDV